MTRRGDPFGLALCPDRLGPASVVGVDQGHRDCGNRNGDEDIAIECRFHQRVADPAKSVNRDPAHDFCSSAGACTAAVIGCGHACVAEPTRDRQRKQLIAVSVSLRTVPTQANEGRRYRRAKERARPPPPVTRSSCGGYDVGGRPRIRQMLNLQPRSCGPTSARAGKRSRCAQAMNGSGLDK